MHHLLNRDSTAPLEEDLTSNILSICAQFDAIPPTNSFTLIPMLDEWTLEEEFGQSTLTLLPRSFEGGEPKDRRFR